MAIELAQRVQNIKPSPTLALSAKAKAMIQAGEDVINMGVGEPDFDTPKHIKTKAIAAIEAGFTKYTAVPGIPELRQAVVDKFKHENQLDYATDQTVVATGGKQIIYNLMQALLNPGDEVIVPAPYWVSYPDMVRLAEATPVIVNANIKQRFKINAEQLAKAISNKTRLFIINSPANPTGMAYTQTELKDLAQVLLQHPEIVILTDDIYEHILWSQDFINIVNAAPELIDRTIVLNGVSKAYAMTGWRIGYAAGPKAIITAMAKIQSQSTSNACSIAQKAALEALTGDQSERETMRQAFKERHDVAQHHLCQIPGIHCLAADGTFYLFPDISEIIQANEKFKDDTDFADQLLHQTGVAVVPGTAFGSPGHLRLSTALSLESIEAAIGRIRHFVAG
ncbi:MAG: pyridoxal phosphate-dependent aminotransferase [Pseudomonadota bacterium]